MTSVACHISVSLDGYVAGPDPTLEEPLGAGGERLHDWAVATRSWRARHGRDGGARNADAEVVEAMSSGVGAYVMGRNMFGGGPGPWEASWRGWWGEDPPFHAPVFVVTHHAREPLAMQGGTTFTFVCDGVAAAVERARAAAVGGRVMVAGGAQVVQQALREGLLEELHLHIVPVLLGGGVRLLEDAGEPLLEPLAVVASPGVTHVSYRVGGARGASRAVVPPTAA